MLTGSRAKKRTFGTTAAIALLAAALLYTPPASADSSSPRLAGYYDRFMAICGDQVHEWEDNDPPRMTMTGIKQVGVGRTNRYGLTQASTLLVWQDDPAAAKQILEGVKTFHAGRSGLFVIRDDDSLWHLETESLLGFGESVADKAVLVADGILTAAIGDSANYYVTRDGALFVKGRAHRGQYGDGRLAETDTFVQTATDVAQVSSHTGHALLRKNDGGVWGTGGNIYGPVSHHGYGDKAVEWGLIFDSAIAIATGSSHSVAIRRDRSLWIWGRNEGLDPKQVMTDVTAVAAGSGTTIALSKGNLWQWETGEQPRRIMACE